MKKRNISLLMIMIAISCFSVEYHVGPNTLGYHDSIAEAIDIALTAGGIAEIILHNDTGNQFCTYLENPIIDFSVGSSNPTTLTIRPNYNEVTGLYDQCIIDGQNSGDVIRILRGYENNKIIIQHLTIKNCGNENYNQGIDCSDTNIEFNYNTVSDCEKTIIIYKGHVDGDARILSADVSNNTFERIDSGNDAFAKIHDYFGFVIFNNNTTLKGDENAECNAYLEISDSENITIMNNSFSETSGLEITNSIKGKLSNNSFEGSNVGISLANYYSEEFLVQDNNFLNCTLGIQASGKNITFVNNILNNCNRGIWVRGSSLIKNNSFINGNTSIEIDENDNIPICHNIVKSNFIKIEGNILREIGIAIQEDVSISITNNTIIGVNASNDHAIMAQGEFVTNPQASLITEFKNNIIWDFPVVFMDFSDQFILDYEYNCSNGFIPLNFLIGNEGLNLTINPLFDDPNTNDYTLTWTPTEKSPCIDTGDPAIKDEDGFKSDMGCYPFEHTNDKWVFYQYNSTPGTPERASTIKWQSFPALDNVTLDQTIVDNVLIEMMAAISPALPKLKTLNYQIGTVETEMSYDLDHERWDFNDFVMTRTKGYKFEFRGIPTYNIDLDISGFQVEEDIAIPLTGLVIDSRSEVIVTEHQNWIGYPLAKTQKWDEAFGPSLSNIYSVQTQSWSMVREKIEPGSPWCYDAGTKYTLSRGDMVIVKCFDDDNSPGFVWYSDGLVSNPVVPARSTAFTYEEELDYIPVYLEFDETDAPIEVAVLADGVCQGAAVVEDGSAQICAYITDNAGENLELELYYGERAAVKTMNKLKVFNAKNNNFESKPVVINPNEVYYKISLKNDQESIEEVPVKAALYNYPNPFNPSTIISYSVPAECQVELEIYNVKGQLVKTLVNGTSPAGEFKVTWQGVDNSGNKVGSGIYFSRLKTGKEVLNKKMVLLK